MFLLLFKSSVSPVLTGNTHTSWQNTREFNNVLSLANLARPCITLYPNLTSVLVATGTSYAVSCLYRNPHLSLVSLFNYSFFNNQLRFYLPYKEIFPPLSTLPFPSSSTTPSLPRTSTLGSVSFTWLASVLTHTCPASIAVPSA